jgi:hypothetical protein
MLGFGYVKVPPTTFVMQFRNGRVTREGVGLSFFYFAPSSTLVAVPVASKDVPFIFSEATADFQTVTVQGHLTFRVAEPKRLAAVLDHSLKGGDYASDDPAKVPTRISQAVQAATRAEIQSRTLRTALVEADAIALRVRAALTASPALSAIGVELLGVSILAIKPAPETARALEAEAREQLLRLADDAVYSRRNNAVEQERRIKESELATEVAVETKQREIEETRLAGQIAVEEQRRDLVAVESENTRSRADAQSYATDKQLEPLRSLDPKSLQVLASGSADPRLLVAMAFQEIATNAAKIGTLNISPDLLESLLGRTPSRRGADSEEDEA